MENWIEVEIVPNWKYKVQNENNATYRVDDDIIILLHDKLLRDVKTKHRVLTWHYFREPNIRFGMEFQSHEEKSLAVTTVANYLEELKGEGLVEEFFFSRHGRAGEEYTGEQDRYYGQEQWDFVKQYFEGLAHVGAVFSKLKKIATKDQTVYHSRRITHLALNTIGVFGREPLRDERIDRLVDLYHVDESSHYLLMAQMYLEHGIKESLTGISERIKDLEEEISKLRRETK